MNKMIKDVVFAWFLVATSGYFTLIQTDFDNFSFQFDQFEGR